MGLAQAPSRPVPGSQHGGDTRPSAVRVLPPIDGFRVANLLPMDNEQIAAYVHNWFVVASGDGQDLTRYEAALRNTVAISPHVARLASSPLMCALLCMLTMKRHAVLPRMHNIYAASWNCCWTRKNSRQTRPARDT